jgi:L-threonylcarbamoyladenylate synthase
MAARVIPAFAPEAIASALDVLRRGGLVAFPTDTVYGVGAMAFDPAAVERIYTAKGRDAAKALPILLAELAGLAAVAQALPQEVLRLAGSFWPGPLTLVVHKLAAVPMAISRDGTVGVRVPDHPIALALLRGVGPLAATSANRSGEVDPLTAEDVAAVLGDSVDLILDGGRAAGGRPSTVVDCTVNPPNLVREGPVSLAAILAALAGSAR